MNVSHAIRDLPVTHRQLDYWIRQGYIRVNNATPGFGVERTLPPKEVRVLTTLAALVADGVKPETAVRLARRRERGRPLFLGGFELIEH